MIEQRQAISMKIRPSIHKKLKIFSVVNNIEMGKIVERALIHKIYHKEGWLDNKITGESR